MKITPMEVTYRYHSGSDLEVVNAARVSFGKESKWEAFFACDADKEDNIESFKLSDKDVKLINYLAKHTHWTPFAHNSITMRIKAPLFVARQAGKHQVGLVWNEVSRRYVDDEPEFWFPKEWRGRPVNVKQGSDGIVDGYGVSAESSDGHSLLSCSDITKYALEWYSNAIEAGVAPEQARMILPQNMQTEWYWTGSLAAFARVCKLRLDPHAQAEIQELAGMIAGVVEPLFPVSWAALMNQEQS